MGRPKARETKRRILEAASALFAERGLGGTSVRDIAAAADVNAALVSHHFGGKDNLYAACVASMYEEIDGLRAELLVALTGDSLTETIRRAVSRGFHYSRLHSGAVKLVMRHVLDTGEVPAERRDELLNPFLHAAATALSDRTGRSVDEVRLVIQTILFLMSRYAITSVAELALVSGLPPDEPEALVLRHVEENLAKQALWLFGLE